MNMLVEKFSGQPLQFICFKS